MTREEQYDILMRELAEALAKKDGTIGWLEYDISKLKEALAAAEAALKAKDDELTATKAELDELKSSLEKKIVALEIR